MEFYVVLGTILHEDSICFNSQRDGILPWARAALISKRSVSIPNGMEFYSSQDSYLPTIDLFKFPTGWNSTYALGFRLPREKEFQFPTEWNSTIIKTT